MATDTQKPLRQVAAADEVVIAPSLLACDFARVGEEIATVERAGCRWLHLDVMDGHFVPNLSMGPPVAKSIRKVTDSFIDAHLMVTDPLRYAKPFAEAGCDLVNFQIETVDQPIEAAKTVRELGVRVGVTLNPDTPAERIFPLLDRSPNDGGVDLVLVMSVFPGFGGQAFMPSVLPKVEQIRKRMGGGQYLQIDGGIDADTIGRAASAGAKVFVAGTAIFRTDDPGKAYQRLLELAREGRRTGGKR